MKCIKVMRRTTENLTEVEKTRHENVSAIETLL